MWSLNSLLSYLFPLHRLEKQLCTFPPPPNSAAGDGRGCRGAGDHTAGLTFSCFLLHQTQTWLLKLWQSRLDNEGRDKGITEIQAWTSMNCKLNLATSYHQTSSMRKIIRKPPLVTFSILSKQKHAYLTQTAFSFDLTRKRFIFS